MTSQDARSDGKKSHYVYMLRCADGSFYTGWTTDLAKRLMAHNAGKSGGGAKYTAMRRPVVLVYYEEFSEKSEALKREIAIKKLARGKKEKLIENFPPRKVLKFFHCEEGLP